MNEQQVTDELIEMVRQGFAQIAEQTREVELLVLRFNAEWQALKGRLEAVVGAAESEQRRQKQGRLKPGEGVAVGMAIREMWKGKPVYHLSGKTS